MRLRPPADVGRRSTQVEGAQPSHCKTVRISPIDIVNATSGAPNVCCCSQYANECSRLASGIAEVPTDAPLRCSARPGNLTRRETLKRACRHGALWRNPGQLPQLPREVAGHDVAASEWRQLIQQESSMVSAGPSRAETNLLGTPAQLPVPRLCTGMLSLPRHSTRMLFPTQQGQYLQHYAMDTWCNRKLAPALTSAGEGATHAPAAV